MLIEEFYLLIFNFPFDPIGYGTFSSGPCYRVETFFAEEENDFEASCRASNLWPLHVNLEVESRSPQETGDVTQM